MIRSDQEDALARGLRELAGDVPDPGNLAGKAAELGRRKLRVRRTSYLVAAAGTAAAATLAVSSLASTGGPNLLPGAGSSSTASSIGDLTEAITVDCLDASGKNLGVNVGQPDSQMGSKETPGQQATRWAAATEFTSRNPEATAVIQPRGPATLVIFKEPDGIVRGVLQFDQVDGAWVLSLLRYC